MMRDAPMTLRRNNSALRTATARERPRYASTAIVWISAMLGATNASAQKPVDLFLSSIEKDSSIPADAKQLIRSTWASCQDCDADEFLTQGLAVLSAPFRRGLDAYDAERYDDCIAIMADLRPSKDLFVAVHAAAYEIKALVAKEHLLDAGQRIEQLLDGRPVESGNVAAYSYFAPEISFLQGFCLLSDLQYDQAQRLLTRFVQRYAESSQRLHIAAQQMLAELQTRQPEQIGEVCDLMTYAGRRLGQRDSGETVQTRQDRIIELLDKLIEDAEENENSGSSSSSDGSDSSQKQGSQQPSNPMQTSKLPSGGPKEGTLQARRRANPGDVWGSMPPAERERILQALRDNFPSRYRQLVEQYYEELAKKP